MKIVNDNSADWNSGAQEQLYFCLDFGLLLYISVSSIVRAPLVVSVIDHSKLTLCLSALGHLHQIHACLALAASNPVTNARNFQSPVQCYDHCTQSLTSSQFPCICHLMH